MFFSVIKTLTFIGSNKVCLFRLHNKLLKIESNQNKKKMSAWLPIFFTVFKLLCYLNILKTKKIDN